MIFSLIIAKLVAFILHLFSKGATTLPGRIALYFKYDLLNKLSENVKIICVTGTNGKTTTCALIEQGLKNSGKSYFINKSGANMISGVATAFILNSTVLGKCKKEYAILECDENSFPIISRYLDASIVAVTNLFRDQLDRYGEIEHTRAKIVEAIKNLPTATVVLNGDCPMTYYISRLVDNEIKTFGINKSYCVKATSDAQYCPVCSSKLNYKSRIFAQLGSFYCSRCGYARVNPDYAVSDIAETNELGSSFIMNNRLVKINLGGLYNVYNYICANAVLDILKLDNSSLNQFDGSFGRMEKFNSNQQEITLLLVKNPVGFSNCLSYALELNNYKNYVFALNDNYADGRDVSWIWDVDFSSIKSRADKVATIGIRAYDMALRLKYDDVITDDIFANEDYSGLLDYIEGIKGNVVVFASYTAMMNMRHYFIKRYGGEEFWEQ